MRKRRGTRKVKFGQLSVGGKAPVSVQSMTKTDTRDVKATVRQIRGLEKVGCQVIRVAVPDEEAARCLGRIKERIKIPLIADIHFDYRLALIAIEEGVDGLRLNPGNIRDKRKIKTIIKAVKAAQIPVRIGINSGSLENRYRSRIKDYDLPLAMVKSAGDYIKIFEDLDFYDLIISLKASDVPATVKAYRLMAERCDYPFHLGITAAGPSFRGAIRSAVGLGILLSEGIGDTIRVSLTGNPREEVKAGYEILKSLGLFREGPTLISCPTCGRCTIDLVKIVTQVERKLSTSNLQPSTFKIAVMGCVVNGPGEAREADIGVAGGKGFGVLFRKGKVIKKVPESKLVETILEEIESKIRGTK
ncbi:MAG: flavodoxin-dependent (E)-4-hydroxy-3-methylbut-2-enyl-diphosphate synthase [Nitrospirae bacterium]|nr:flavodoxin-dependent (E)-4-hydroxy-3-methylbut-2-enyl-diphosphate synthase [Nitrospirota bacterium]